MKIYLVGGAVRDKLLGLPIKERDYVVVGATVNDMLKQGFRQVGKEFPVFLHPKTGEEYALARAERKVKPGYKGFVFDTSTEVTLEEDLKRRDLTINAMAYDLDSQAIIDPFHGEDDIQKKLLRHVSEAFVEDPVRILRVGRFLARYTHLGFHIYPETMRLMGKMVAAGEVDALVAERVWKEFSRALAEKNPEMFFTVLVQCGALPKLFPFLLRLEAPGIYSLPSLKALQIASTLSDDPMIRFASLLYNYSEDGTPQSAKKSIAELCDRYRAPNDYRKLALMTALYHEEAFKAQTLSAEMLLKLFTALDIFRREERFKQFLSACQAVSAAKQIDFDPKWLAECATAAKSVDVQKIIAEGIKEGPLLAAKLKEKRQENIAAWLSKTG